MRSRFLVLLVIAGASALGGCARAHAKVAPESPPLEVPAPPPREIEPSGAEEPPQPMTLPQEPARNAPLRPRPTPPVTARPEPSRPPEPPKPEPASPMEPPPVEEAPKPPPTTTLQTTPPNAEGELERSVKATLVKAANDLNRIDYRVLSTDARSQYDTAKSFIRQAESAIRAKNLVFAKNLADKAAALAVQLGGK